MDYTVSTQTFVVYCNSKYDHDLDLVFENIVISENLKSVKFGSKTKGVVLCKNTNSNYLKCMTITLRHDDKILNVKLFKNGSIQVTGCKNLDHVLYCADAIYRMLNIKDVESNFVSMMINANFDIGFKMNRERLNVHMLKSRKINVPPISSGYMGTKIKIPLPQKCDDIMIPRKRWTVDQGFIDMPSISYQEFFSKDFKKINKKLFASVGIFQNGKILMSGINKQIIDFTHSWLIDILSDGRSFIEIKEKPVKTFRRD